MREATGIILSVTDRYGIDNFCSTVLIKTENGPQQLRLLGHNWRTLNIHMFPYRPDTFFKKWDIGTEIRFVYNNDVASIRPTHVEDTLFEPKSVKFTGRVYTNREVIDSVTPLAFNNLTDLFPGLRFGTYNKAWIDSQSAPRSFGYIRAQQISLFSRARALRCLAGATNTQLRAQLKDRDWLRELNNTTTITMPRGIVRFALAGPWYGKTPNQFPTPRCYVMASWVRRT